nr:MAG TPA: hypothetical protein [Caudoviricetes sp.]
MTSEADHHQSVRRRHRIRLLLEWSGRDIREEFKPVQP